MLAEEPPWESGEGQQQAQLWMAAVKEIRRVWFLNVF
jgi:hypothetical protein